MQPTNTIRNALLWVTLAITLACNKDPDNTEPARIYTDIETLSIPTSFQQNILLHGFTSTACSVCPVLDETFKKAYHNFKGRLSALILHRDALRTAASDSVFDFFHITGMPAWFYFPVLPDSTTFMTMTQKFGISISSLIRGDSAFIKVVTGFCDDVNTPVKIAVWLTEDKVTGYKYNIEDDYRTEEALPFSNLVNSLDDFQHNHVLRKVISASVFGDAIASTRTIAGVRDVKSYSFLIPEECSRNNLRVIAFAYTGVHLYGMVNNVNETKLGENIIWN